MITETFFLTNNTSFVDLFSQAEELIQILKCLKIYLP